MFSMKLSYSTIIYILIKLYYGYNRHMFSCKKYATIFRKKFTRRRQRTDPRYKIPSETAIVCANLGSLSGE